MPIRKILNRPTVKRNTENVFAISTRASIREMIMPGLVAGIGSRSHLDLHPKFFGLG